MKSIRNLLASALVASLAIGALSLPASAQVTPGNAAPNPINLLDNGAFNIAQRGTANVGTITTVAKYLWDRWAAYSGTSTTSTLSNVTTPLPTGGPGFTNAAQLERNSAVTAVVAPYLVQEIPTSEVTPLAGQPVTLSFWALAGTNFSAASSNLTVKVSTGTGSDEGLATLITGWAGAGTAINASQPITTSWQRYAWTGTLPAGTTEAAVQLGWTPVGTAGTADYIQVTGVQLERGTTASAFEWRPYGVDLAKVQRYYWQWGETVSSTAVSPFMCEAQSSTVAVCLTSLHVPFRVAPTVACTPGTMKRQVAGTDTTVSACAAAATTNGVSSLDGLAITATVASGDTAGFASVLMSGNSTGGGLITATADF